MNYIFIILTTLILAVSCLKMNDLEEKAAQEKKNYKTYTQVNNPVEMKCAEYTWNHCGVFLYDCEDGKEYSCMTNIIQK